MKQYYIQKLKIIFLVFLFSSINSFSQEELFMKKIYFETNKSDISQNSKILLDSLVTIARKDSIYFVNIEGFTDEKGLLENNILLSEKRAKKVNDYLVENIYNKVYIKHSGKGIYEETTIDSLQRNVTLKIRFVRYTVCATYEPIIHEMESPYITNIREYYSTEDMIRHKMFAIDTSENIIKTAGMISFNADNKYIKYRNTIEEHYLKICIPLREGETYDKDMKVWTNKPNKKGETRWLEKDYKISFDSITKCYSILIECRDLDDFNKINIDKDIPSNFLNFGDEVIYFSSFRKINFYDVEIPKSTFSAIASEEKSNLYAFVNDMKNNSDNLVFKGKFRENGIEKMLTVDLKKCKLYKHKGSKHYYLTQKTNYFINDKEYNKKGFWAWVKRIFTKE